MSGAFETSDGLTAQARRAVPVTPDDGANLPELTPKALWVSVGGTLSVIPAGQVADTGVALCRLSEFLAICAPAGVRVSVEPKAYRTQADVTLVVNQMVAAVGASRATLASFILSDLTVARAANSAIRVQYIVGSVSEAQAATAISDVVAVGLPADLCISRTAAGLTALTVTNAKAAGLKVVTWTATGVATAIPSLILGVDAIYSDDPAWDN